MNKFIKLFLKEAKKDKIFIQLVKDNIEDFKVPNIFSNTQEEGAFVLLYIGYLLGKHEENFVFFSQIYKSN